MDTVVGATDKHTYVRMYIRACRTCISPVSFFLNCDHRHHHFTHDKLSPSYFWENNRTSAAVMMFEGMSVCRC